MGSGEGLAEIAWVAPRGPARWTGLGLMPRELFQRRADLLRVAKPIETRCMDIQRSIPERFVPPEILPSHTSAEHEHSQQEPPSTPASRSYRLHAEATAVQSHVPRTQVQHRARRGKFRLHPKSPRSVRQSSRRTSGSVGSSHDLPDQRQEERMPGDHMNLPVRRVLLCHAHCRPQSSRHRCKHGLWPQKCFRGQSCQRALFFGRTFEEWQPYPGARPRKQNTEMGYGSQPTANGIGLAISGLFAPSVCWLAQFRLSLKNMIKTANAGTP